MTCLSIPTIHFMNGDISFVHSDVFTGYDLRCAIMVIGIIDVIVTSAIAITLLFVGV